MGPELIIVIRVCMKLFEKCSHLINITYHNILATNQTDVEIENMSMLQLSINILHE